MGKPILLLLMLGMLSCSKSDDDTTSEEPRFEGNLSDIEEYYTPELVEALQDLGFVFRLGSDPSNIEGIYDISPAIIQASTTGMDSIGQRLSDQIVTLSNQNNDSLTIDFRIEGNGQTSLGIGSFISGSKNEFSIFIKSETKNENSIAVETATSITGKMSEEGILNFQFAGLMLDDRGAPEGEYIKNNTGRLIYDSDEFSPEIQPENGLISQNKSKIPPGYQYNLLSAISLH